MLDSHHDEHPPSAHAEIEIRLGPILPSVKASAAVPGPEARRLIRLIGYIATVLAMAGVVGVGTWSGAPVSLMVIMVAVVVALGIAVTLRE